MSPRNPPAPPSLSSTRGGSRPARRELCCLHWWASLTLSALPNWGAPVSACGLGTQHTHLQSWSPQDRQRMPWRYCLHQNLQSKIRSRESTKRWKNQKCLKRNLTENGSPKLSQITITSVLCPKSWSRGKPTTWSRFVLFYFQVCPKGKLSLPQRTLLRLLHNGKCH